MKNILISLSFLAAVAFPAVASADSFFQANDGSIQPCSMASSTAEKQSCDTSIGSVNTSLLMEPWGITNGESQKLIVPAGTEVIDELGVHAGRCPDFLIAFGCFNLTSLDYWKNQARALSLVDSRFAVWRGR